MMDKEIKHVVMAWNTALKIAQDSRAERSWQKLHVLQGKAILRN